LAVIIAAIFLLVCTSYSTVLAHTPHDDVQDLEISPHYDENRTVFAIVRGNFFRSTDGGENWQRELRGLNNPVGLSALTLSTANEAVLYAGAHNAKIYKTENGGDSWFDVTSNLDATTLHLLVAAPATPDVVLAVDEVGTLFRSENGAESWNVIDGTALDNKQLTIVAFPATNPQQVFAGDVDGMIYRSDDLGRSWQRLGAIEDAGGITAIAFSDKFDADGIMFVGTDEGRLFKSSDAGETYIAKEEGLSGQEVTDLLIPPGFANDNQLYALTKHGGVFRSVDGGDTWQGSSEGTWRNNQSLEYGRPSFSVIRATPSFSEDNTLFLGTFVGIFKSTDRGTSWQKKITLPENIVAGAALSNTRDNTPTLAVTHYIGELLIEDGSETIQVKFNKGWSQLALVEKLLSPIIATFLPQLDSDRLFEQPFRLLDVAFSPNYDSDQTLFVSMVNHVLISEDGGHSWKKTPLYTDPLGISTIAGDERDIPYLILPSPDFAQDQTLFVGMSGGEILKSEDRGQTFATIGKVPGGKLSALAISPNFAQDQTLFAANSLSGIAKSIDGGETWNFVSGAGEGETKGVDRQVSFAISPNFSSDQLVLAGTDTGLLQSVDGGEIWQQASCEYCGRDNTIAAVAFSPNFAKDQEVFMSVKGRGLFKSSDGGQTFVEIGESLLDNGIIIGNLDETPPTSGNLKLSPSFDRDRMMVGFSDIAMVRSTDGGDSWDNLSDLGTGIDETYLINIVYGKYLFLPLLVLVGTVALVMVVVLIVLVIRRRRLAGSRTKTTTTPSLP
jgi:photosystem II stability/assembly factor-like uncharacterized protein